jgi:hypothetical protein
MSGPAPSTRWRGAPAEYLPIAEHGIVGDLHTAALVGSDGTIEWFAQIGSTGRACSGRCLIATAAALPDRAG